MRVVMIRLSCQALCGDQSSGVAVSLRVRDGREILPPDGSPSPYRFDDSSVDGNRWDHRQPVSHAGKTTDKSPLRNTGARNNRHNNNGDIYVAQKGRH